MARPDPAEREHDLHRGPLNWLAVLLMAALGALQLYAGFRGPTAAGTPGLLYALAGVVLVAGATVFLTDYWRPALYLVVAAVGLYVVTVRLVAPADLDAAGVLAVAGGLALFGLGVWLFATERVEYLTE